MKYLFTRNKFQWREQQFSIWTIADAVVVVLGLTIVMPIFSKILKISDPLGGAIAALARGSSRLCVALAPQSKFLFLGNLYYSSGDSLYRLSTNAMSSCSFPA